AIEDESEDSIDFAYLEDAHVSGVDFQDINFRSAGFAGVDFGQAEFGGADYSGSTFENANLSDKDLYGSTFHHCNFERADLSEAELELVEFNGSNLRRAKLERIKCSQTNFAGTNLEGAILTSSLLTEARFENARLRNAVLDNAKISERTFDDTCCYEDEERWADAASVYRALMALSRENSIPQLARMFYFRHKQCRRHQYRQEAGLRSLNQLRNSAAWLRAEGSRFITGYGDRPKRVIVTSGLFIVISALGYIGLEGIQQNGNPVTPNTCQEIQFDNSREDIESHYLTF
ncbi:MAG: pentapeptide repeat-containing protein, partial [Halobacteriaceae archaeon]